MKGNRLTVALLAVLCALTLALSLYLLGRVLGQHDAIAAL